MQRHWGCYPFHFFRYDLFRADCDLDDYALLEYIPEFFLYHVYLPPLEGNGDPAVLADKIQTVNLFRQRGIAQPEVLGWAADGRWHDGQGRPVATRALLDALVAAACPRLFLKPAGGSGGYGIQVYRPSPSGWRLADGSPLTAEVLERMAGSGRWLAQFGVRQSPETARFYDGAVNTYRITTRCLAGHTAILCAVIRIGGGGREVDNAALGGIMVGVDRETGQTTAHAANELMDCFRVHPDSGWEFRAESLAGWPEVRDYTLAAAARLPEFSHIAWDVAATVDGPRALEANIGFGIDCYQSVLGGLATAFGITDPRIYWRGGRELAARIVV